MSVSPIKTVGQGDALNARTLALLRCMIAVSGTAFTTWVAPNEPLWLIRVDLPLNRSILPIQFLCGVTFLPA